MRGHLLIIAGGAAIAVGGLAFAATTAYAAPIHASSAAVTGAPALVVPPNHHPAEFANQPVSPADTSVIRVAPGGAIDITDGGSRTDSASPSPTSPAETSGSDGRSPEAVPPVVSTPPVEHAPSGGSSNDGNDEGNKGTGSNKGKGKSGG